MIRQNQKAINGFQILIDALIVMSVFLYYLSQNQFLFLQEHIPSSAVYLWAIITVSTYVFYYNLFRLYRSYRSKKFSKITYELLKANVFSILTISCIAFALSIFNMIYLLILQFFLTNLLVSLLYRLLLRKVLQKIRAKGFNQKYLVLIGVNDSTHSFLRNIQEAKEMGYSCLGYFNDTADPSLSHIPYLGNFDALDGYIAKTILDDIIVMLKTDDPQEYLTMIKKCEYWGVKFSLIPNFFGKISDRIYLSNFNGLSVFNLRPVPLDDRKNYLLKQSFDIVVSFLLLIILSPFMALVALLIRCTTKGPVIYKQTRVGANRLPFQMYKFCSMVVQAEQTKEMTTKNDSRVTPIGKFLRKYSIDELPQLYNVLKREMSLVGPRPELPHFVNQFQSNVNHYMVKHYIKPGMTGLSQIKGLRGNTSIEERIKWDIYYIETWSFFQDLNILGLTITKGIFNENAY